MPAPVFPNVTLLAHALRCARVSRAGTEILRFLEIDLGRVGIPTLPSLLNKEEMDNMSLRDVIGKFSFVVKLNVSDLGASVAWYEQKLKLVHDPRYDVPGWWAQLNVPEVPGLAIGLNKGAPVKGSDTPTLVVPDIAAARDALLAEGVSVGPIQTVPPGVQLAFFNDPDGNELGLRQNPPQFPQEFR